ncbi:MAG: LysR family transcriptional regulator [Burkholderiales bacterium]|nr:MAG: LysR family transcriptional regulator [Burkholderiales bacterium]
MNLRFVEAFYWVATLKSVTRAADKLFLTQSAMSSRIAALEQELGVLLLDRRNKQFRLTTAGLRFLTYAQQMLELQREVRSVMGSTPEGEPVVIRLGAIESILHSWLVPWIERLRKDYPALSLELSVEPTPVLIEQISRGTLDIVFAALPASGDGVRAEPMDSMAMGFFGHREIHRKRRYGRGDFSELDVMTFQRGSQPHVALLDVFRNEGVTPRMVHPMSSISAMVQLVQGGFGVATLPKRAIRRLAGMPDLKPLPCDIALKPLPLYVSYRVDPSNQAIESIVKSSTEYASGVHKNGA